MNHHLCCTTDAVQLTNLHPSPVVPHRLEWLRRPGSQRAGHPGPDQGGRHQRQMGPVQGCGGVTGRPLRELPEEQELQLCGSHEGTGGRYERLSGCVSHSP